MNNTLTLQQFAQMVAASADISMDDAQSFITSLTDHIKGLLASGEKAHLPGIGTFAIIEADGKPSVMFAPDDSFADAVNEPFAMFEPIELDGEAAIDIAQSEVAAPQASETVTENADDEPADAQSESPVAAPQSPQPTPTEEEVEAVTAQKAQEEPTQGPTNIPEKPETTDVSIEPSIPSIVSPVIPTAPAHPSRQYRFGWLCAGIAIGAVIGYLAAALIYTSRWMSEDYSTDYEEATEYTDSIPSVTEDIEAAATVDDYATQPAILCSDTVTVKRYITHMAKDYYGDRNFWVYIYEANKEILGHPERTLPGTVVQIPTPASIPANPSNPDDIRQAKQLASEIYARFQ